MNIVKIDYWQMVEEIDDETQQPTGEQIRQDLFVELDMDSPHYQNQIATIDGYCDGDYQITPICPTLEEKLEQIKRWCQEAIISGINFDCGKGLKHYTLEDHKQEVMKDHALLIEKGAQRVIWRDSSRFMHEIYSAQEFMNLYNEAKFHRLKCQLHSDGLEEYVSSLFEEISDETGRPANEAEISAITWETKLPIEIENKIETLMTEYLSELAQLGGNAE